MVKAVVVALFAMICLEEQAEASRLGVVVNGKAIHLEQGESELNEKNWGAGVQYEFDRVNARSVSFVTASSLIDSRNNTSYNLGYGVRRNLHRIFGDVDVDAGVVAFLMTRKTYNDNNPFLGAVPVLTVGNRYVAVNSTYVPPVIDRIKPFVFFQFVYFVPD